MKTLFAFIVALLIFSQLHWTQEFRGVTVTYNWRGNCQDGAAKVAGGCLAREATLTPNLLSHDYTLELSSGEIVRLTEAALGAVSGPVDGDSMTWSTYALVVLMLGFVLSAVFRESKVW